jgi:MFS family permease
MIFAFASILTTIEIPQLYPEKFGFNTQQVGLQYLAIIIGSLIGELIGGRMSDYWMQFGTNRRGGVRPPYEFRLWLSYLAIPLAVGGVAMFLVCIEQAGSHWTVVPDVGAAIAAVGNQIATTVLITYAVDCYREEAASVGVFITFVRQIWGFIGPFW